MRNLPAGQLTTVTDRGPVRWSKGSVLALTVHGDREGWFRTASALTEGATVWRKSLLVGLRPAAVMTAGLTWDRFGNPFQAASGCRRCCH